MGGLRFFWVQWVVIFFVNFCLENHKPTKRIADRYVPTFCLTDACTYYNGAPSKTNFLILYALNLLYLEKIILNWFLNRISFKIWIILKGELYNFSHSSYPTCGEVSANEKKEWLTDCIGWLAGWELNILESVVVSLAIGLSVDFTLHYGIMYKLAVDTDRYSVLYSVCIVYCVLCTECTS